MINAYLCYNLLLIFIIIYFSLLIILFLIRFLKYNGIKSLIMSIFNKENKLILIVTFIFIIFFWLSFYLIYYTKIEPSIRITQTIKNSFKDNVYSNSCIVGSECMGINMNVNTSYNLKINIVDYSYNYIVFKVNNPMFIKECDKCRVSVLEVNKEYKLLKNHSIYLEPVTNNINNYIYYNVDLY